MEVVNPPDRDVDVTTLYKNVWGSFKYGPRTISTSELEATHRSSGERDQATKGVPVQVYYDDKVVEPIVAFFDVSTSKVTVIHATSTRQYNTHAIRAAGVRVIQLEQDVIIESIVGAASTIKSERVNIASGSATTVYPASFNLQGGVDWCEFATTASITDEEQHLGIVAGGHVAHNGVVTISGGAVVDVATEVKVTASCRVLTTDATHTVRMMYGTADGEVVTITGNTSDPQQEMGTESILAVTARAKDGILAQFCVSAERIKCDWSDTSREHPFGADDPPIIGLQQQTIATDIGSRCCFALRQDCVVLYVPMVTALTVKIFLRNVILHTYYTAFAALTVKADDTSPHHSLSTYVYVGNSDGRLIGAKISHSYSTAVDDITDMIAMSEVQLGPPITHVACCATDATSKKHVVVIVRGMEVTAFARTGTSPTPGAESQCVGHHDVASLAIQSIGGVCTLDIVDASGTHVAYTLDVASGVATFISATPKSSTGKWPMVVCSNRDGVVASFHADRRSLTRAVAAVTNKPIESTVNVPSDESVMAFEAEPAVDYNFTIKPEGGSIDVRFSPTDTVLRVDVGGVRIAWSGSELRVFDDVAETSSVHAVSVGGEVFFKVPDTESGQRTVKLIFEPLRTTAYPLRILPVGWYAASMDVTPTLTVVAGRNDANNVVMRGFGGSPAEWSTANFQMARAPANTLPIAVRAGPAVNNIVIVSAHNDAMARFQLGNRQFAETSAQSDTVKFASDEDFKTNTKCDANIPTGMSPLNHERYGEDSCRVYTFCAVKTAPPLRVEDAVFCSADAGANAYKRASADEEEAMKRTVTALKQNSFSVTSVVFPAPNDTGKVPGMKPDKRGDDTQTWATDDVPSTYTPTLGAGTADAVGMSRLGVLTAQLLNNTAVTTFCRLDLNPVDVSSKVLKHTLAKSFFVEPTIKLSPGSYSSILQCLQARMKMAEPGVDVSTYQRSMWGQYNQCNIAVDNSGVVTGRMSPLWCKYAFSATTLQNVYTTNQAVIRTDVIETGQSAQYGADVDRHTVYVKTTSTDASTDVVFYAKETVTCFIDDSKFAETAEHDTDFGMDAAFSDEISKPCVLHNDAYTVAIFTVGKHVYRYEVVTATGVSTLKPISSSLPACTNVFVAASATKCVVAFCNENTIDCHVHTAPNSTDPVPARKLTHGESRGLSCMAMHTMHGVDYLALAYCEKGRNRVTISFHRVDQYINTQPCGSHTVECEAHETSKECTTKLRLPQYQTATRLDTVVPGAKPMLMEAYKNRSLDRATLADYNRYRCLNNVGIARELSAMCLYTVPGSDRLFARLAWTYFVKTEHSDTIDLNRPFKEGDKVALMPGLARLNGDIQTKETATVAGFVGTNSVRLHNTSDGTETTIPRWRLVRYRHVPSTYTPYTNDKLQFCYSFHTDKLSFQLRCEDLQEGDINYDTSVHSVAVRIAKSNAVRENTIRTLSFNCQKLGAAPALPYDTRENGAYPWGERKTNNNYVSATHSTANPPAPNDKWTERWSDIYFSVKFLTGTSEMSTSYGTWNDLENFYGFTAANFKYASRFNSLTPRAVSRCVTRSLVQSPYSHTEVKKEIGVFTTNPTREITLKLRYFRGTLTEDAAVANATIELCKKNAKVNEVTAFFKCYLQDVASITEHAVTYEWKKCSSSIVDEIVQCGDYGSKKCYYMFTLKVNDKAYQFVACDTNEDEYFTIATIYPDDNGKTTLTSAPKTIDNKMASVLNRHTSEAVKRHCMAERVVPTFQCVYSLAYLAGSNTSVWQDVAEITNPRNSIAQSAHLLQSKHPNVLYLVREWIVNGVRHIDNAFCRRLSIPGAINEDTWRVDSLAIDKTVGIVLRRTGGGRAVKLKYEAELDAHHHADALAHTIPAQVDNDNHNGGIDMTDILKSVAARAASPAALRLLVQAIGRQYEYRRNAPNFNADELTVGITETAMNVDLGNNLEVYYKVAGTVFNPYVLGTPADAPTNGAPLYRLRDCTASGANIPAAVQGLLTVRYLAPEVSRWSKDETLNDAQDTTMRPGTNGFATPNYNRLMSSTIQTKISHFVKYNAACTKAKLNAKIAEWFDPVERSEITGTFKDLPESLRDRTKAARYMPPLPGDVAGDIIELYKFRGAVPSSYETSDKHEMRLIEYNDSDSRHRPDRTYDSNPTRMTDVAKGVCDQIATNGIVPITSHVVRVENNEVNPPTVNGMRVGQFVTFSAFNRTYCASATSFAATLSNTDVVQSRPIQEIFGSELGPLFDARWSEWSIWKKLVRTPLVVELDGNCTAFVVSGAALNLPELATDTFVNSSGTSTLRLREVRGSDFNEFEWSVDTATNSRFLALVTGPQKKSATIHILRTPNIYKMVENNGLLHFASHVALYTVPGPPEHAKCVVLHPTELKKGTYTFSTLFGACSPDERAALRCGKVDGMSIEIAVPSTVSINIGEDNGEVAAFSVGGTRYSGRAAADIFTAWPSRVCTRGLECGLMESRGARYFLNRDAVGMNVALHDTDIADATAKGASTINAFVYGTRANQNKGTSCRINTKVFGRWCATNFAGHFFPDNKFVQTGIRAVFVNNVGSAHKQKMPFTQLNVILKTLTEDVALQAGYIRDTTYDIDAIDTPESNAQVVPRKHRRKLYRLLDTAPKEYRLVVPVTVTLSGHNITPTVMNIEGWYAVTARMLQAADMIRHEVTKVLRLKTTVTSAVCCRDVTAFGEAIVDQALINIQTLDSGLHFKDRSALKLSTHQRKAAVFRIVAAIKADGHGGGGSIPSTRLKNPGESSD